MLRADVLDPKSFNIVLFHTSGQKQYTKQIIAKLKSSSPPPSPKIAFYGEYFTAKQYQTVLTSSLRVQYETRYLL